jgi:hypothetical protein
VTITGSMNVEDDLWNSYSASSLTWTQGLWIKSEPNASGTLQNGSSAVIAPTCGSDPDCTVTSSLGTDWHQVVPMTPGVIYNDAFTETDTGPASSGTTTPAQTLHESLGIEFTGQASTGVPSWSFIDNYLVGRCDFYLTKSGAPSTGCVNHQFTPTLTLSRAQGGSSADMVAWAQTTLDGHWGLQGEGQPLHRKVDYDTSRKAMCGSFTKDPVMTAALAVYQDQDTCDEYPFAGTYENPANSNEPEFDGDQCAQVTAVQVANPSNTNEAADWPTVTPINAPTGAESCVRGHIPGKLNFSVGGSYGNLVRAARLIDNDPFWVKVTS